MRHLPLTALVLLAALLAVACAPQATPTPTFPDPNP